MTPDSTDALLAERGRTHGRFEDHASITQQIKRIIIAEVCVRHNEDRPSLTDGQLEALEMIAHKIGRILAGDADYADHWDDIAGYALLGRDSARTPTSTSNH